MVAIRCVILFTENLAKSLFLLSREPRPDGLSERAAEVVVIYRILDSAKPDCDGVAVGDRRIDRLGDDRVAASPCVSQRQKILGGPKECTGILESPLPFISAHIPPGPLANHR